MSIYSMIKPPPSSKKPSTAANPLLSIEGDPSKTIEEQRKREATGKDGFYNKIFGAIELGKITNSLDRGLAAQPGPANDPAMMAAAAREMQLRRMNRGRGGTVLTGTGATKLG